MIAEEVLKAGLQSATAETPSRRERLRVALFLNSYIQPRWIEKVISGLLASSVAEIVLVIKNGAAERAEGGLKNRIAGIIDQRAHFLYKLYSRLDAHLFTQEPNAFAPVSIEALLANVATIELVPIQKKFSDYFSAEDIEAISKHNVDVALRFGFRILRGDALRIAKHGVWSYHHGDNLHYRGGPPGFWEVMEGNPVTGAVLQILSEDLDNGQVIYRAFVDTDQSSVTRNANKYYWEAAEFVGRKLRDLHDLGPSALMDPDPSPWKPYNHRLYKAPRNGEMIRLLTRFLRRHIVRKVTGLFYFNQWVLAYKINPKGGGVDNTFYNFQKLIPPKDRFWADPFPVKKDGKYYIFFEELLYKTRKGTLAVVEVDQKGIVNGPWSVLERPYHLSYPLVFRWQDEFYMIPETRRARNIGLYRCVSFPDKWQFDRVLVSEIEAVDATLAEIEGQWWMFASVQVPGAAELYELHLFYAETPLGPWRPHRGNPVKADTRSSRPAGKIIYKSGTYYRPAQVGAGYAISINQIGRLSPLEYSEQEVCRVLPDWADNLTGVHTLNHEDGLTVLDYQTKRRK